MICILKIEPWHFYGELSHWRIRYLAKDPQPRACNIDVSASSRPMPRFLRKRPDLVEQWIADFQAANPPEEFIEAIGQWLRVN